MAEGGARRRLLLVEAHHGLRNDLSRALSRVGFFVDAFASTTEAMEERENDSFAVQVIDLCAAGAREWLAERGDIENTIVLAGDPASLGPNGSAVPDGMEILYKPFSIHRLETRVLMRRDGFEASRSGIGDPLLETREPGLARLIGRAKRLARHATPITIEGELGTGCRALAEAIHNWSPRSGHPFLLIERAELDSAGAAMMEERIEKIFLGSMRGTLVLVDPADFPPRLQTALVAGLRRFEQEGPRWLTIARHPLEQSVREGRLALELQYRLDATHLVMPPLRDRVLDQLDLCSAAARLVARELGESAPELDEELVEFLARDGFPGNWLGLESRLRSCLVRANGDRARVHEILAGESGRSAEKSKSLPLLNLRTLERDTIIRALAHWDGNRTRASEALGISVRTLRNKIREYALR